MSGFCSECGESANGGKFCAHCGAQLAATKPKAEPKPKAATKSAARSNSSVASTCPRCKSSDAVQSVASIVDSGVSHSVGSTFGMGTTFTSQPNTYYSGVSVSSSSSALASRLSLGYPQASFNYWYLLAGVMLASWLFYKLFARGVDMESGAWVIILILAIAAGILPGMLLGWIMGTVAKKKDQRELEPQIYAISKAQETLRSSFYCFKDDLVFRGSVSGTPEQYIDRLLR